MSEKNEQTVLIEVETTPSRFAKTKNALSKIATKQNAALVAAGALAFSAGFVYGAVKHLQVDLNINPVLSDDTPTD